MPTLKVDSFHIFKNEFTTLGRVANDRYRQLNKRGCHYILERKLPDKSRVIIAYPNQSSAKSKFVLKINPDGSIIQKTNETTKTPSYLTLTNKMQTITKVYLDASGKKIKEIIKRLTYDLDNKVSHKHVTKRTDKYASNYEYDTYGGRHSQCNRIINNVKESYSNIALDGSENQSLYVQTMDGTKTFTRFIDGIDYSFTTKK